MCPEKELISAYYDGEADGRWSSELKNHFENCSSCSTELRKLQSVSSYLSDVEVPDEEIIKDRIYSAIERRRNITYNEPFWRKHFEISFSAIAGAAALIIVLCAALLFGLRNISEPARMVEEIPQDSGDTRLQIISMEDAAAYLFSDDSGFDVLITIPASDVLSLSGEPQLIREADYKRSQ